MKGGHMNRVGARHVGEPSIYAPDGKATKTGRVACLYGAAMIAKHMPAFAAIAHEFEAVLRPPASILLTRAGNPDGATLTYDIPALLLPACVEERARQREFGE